MRWDQVVQYAIKTDTGMKRAGNQDRAFAALCTNHDSWREQGHIFIVADGMGGHAVGDLASKIAVETLQHTFQKINNQSTRELLESAYRAANQEINRRGSLNQEFHRMGTTCTTLVLNHQGAWVGHVGDSRTYRIRGNRIDQMTFDHSLQWELARKQKKTLKEIQKTEPKNVLTRSLGPEKEMPIDVEGPFPVMPGDLYLLCSDGLTNYLNDSEIGMIVSLMQPSEACRMLVNLANLRGGADNITAIIAQVNAAEDSGVFLPEPPVIERTVEGDQTALNVGVFISAFLITMGIVLIVAGYLIPGLIVTSLSGVALFWLVVTLFQQAKKPTPERPADDPEETIYWRPYRTASAAFSNELLEEISRVTKELEDLANKRGWKFDWQHQQNLYAEANRKIEKHHYDKVLQAYSVAIDHLITVMKGNDTRLGQAAAGVGEGGP